MATQVLAIAATAGEVATFTLTADTMVWIHRPSGECQVGIDIKGSDGLFSPLTTFKTGGTSNSGMLPAGDYRATRIKGTCGFQRAA